MITLGCCKVLFEFGAVDLCYVSIPVEFFISSEISSLAAAPIVFSNNKASGNSVLSRTTFRPSLFFKKFNFLIF